MKKLYLFILLLTLTLTSCFHKDVINDRADDIDATLLYQGKEGAFIICREKIFQATSKSSGQGITKISGYNDYRISSYDVSTGKLSARVNLKEGGDDGECILLGITGDKVWLYSLNKDLGLHCRDPKTLDVIANQQKLCDNAQLKALSFAKPKWYDLPRCFSFDWAQGKIMLSDMQGYTYYYNPANDSVQRTSDKISVMSLFSKTYLENSAPMSNGKTIYLSNENRNVIEYAGIAAKGGLSFLSGKLILDNDAARAGAIKKEKDAKMRIEIKNLQDSIAAFNSDIRHVDARKSAMTTDEMNTEFANEQRQYRLDADLRYFKYPETAFDKRLLTDEPNTFLVFYSSDVSDTAHAIISKIKMGADTTFTEEWKCTLNNFCFDPDKASKKGAFETVFSKGDPNFGYQWFTITNGNLVFIGQIQMACIDMKTGKLLWTINI